jgi:type IV pilus assembly protein PilB
LWCSGNDLTIMSESASLLVRAGLVRADQIAAAHALRQHEGGSLGECLIRMGAIDEETLVEFYHRRLMIPRLPSAKLERIPPKVVALVSADMAAEFRVIPVEIDNEGTITLAMSDPSDNHAVDEVAFFADRFIVRAVASESAVRRAIERCYGIRFRAAEERAPPAPAKPAPLAKPTRAELEEQIVLLTKIKQLDATPLPIPLPPPDDYQPAYIGQGTPEEPILLTTPVAQDSPPPRRERDTLPGFPAVVAPDPPLAQLRAAIGRDEIARAVLDYVGQLAGRVVFFVVKKTLLVGHDARGFDVGAVRHVAVSMEAPSLFRDVVASRLPYRGPLPETAANRAFAHALGGLSSEVLLMPIAVRTRIVALLFADSSGQALPDAALHATTREAGLAFERLILEGKHAR